MSKWKCGFFMIVSSDAKSIVRETLLSIVKWVWLFIPFFLLGITFNSTKINFRTRDATYDYKDGSVHMHLRGKPVTLYAPTELKNSYSLYETNPTSPDKSLKLEWVYGYRGKDARSNLYLLPTGELVYFMASVVVLFNPDLNKQRHYMGHTEEVKW